MITEPEIQTSATKNQPSVTKKAAKPIEKRLHKAIGPAANRRVKKGIERVGTLYGTPVHWKRKDAVTYFAIGMTQAPN